MSALNLLSNTTFREDILHRIPKPSYSSNWKVPHGDYYVSFERATKYCTVIPVINEGINIGMQLKKMRSLGQMRWTDLIIADGDSTDGSIPLDFLKSIGVRSLIIKKDIGKLSAQLRMGYAYALTEGYEGIITIDGNNKDSVESIPLFAEALDNGFDYAQASRFITGGRGINTPPIRHLAVKFIHAPLVSLAAGRRFSDTTQGYRGYSSKYLKHPQVQPFRDIFQTYELLAYLSARASQLGLNATEIPTERRYPKKGPIPTKIGFFRGNVELMKILLNLLAGKYNPKESKEGKR